ncbi:hypothetical protein Q5O14_07720 [Eubacteriaceae bacterium ES2]|nr:hypothetical protein Q5O14_07720 [Eubacteriaceae bacterium ES2]
MEPSDVISSLIALIAVAISIATLQQNRNMIEESTRPYIAVYVTDIDFTTQVRYLIVKNFGQTGAKIISFKTSPDLLNITLNPGVRPFGKIENSFLSPNQYHLCAIDFDKCREFPDVTVEIAYESKHSSYSDKYTLNLISESDNLANKHTKEGNELKYISNALQNLVERQL